MIPDGIWCSTNSPAPVSTVWPALAPPWYRTTRSARSARTSTILPLPSSPHWAPTTTTHWVFGPNTLDSPDGNKKAPAAGAKVPGPCPGILCGKLSSAQDARQPCRDVRGAIEPQPGDRVVGPVHNPHRAPVALHDRDTFPGNAAERNAVDNDRQPAPPPRVHGIRHRDTEPARPMHERSGSTGIVEAVEVDDAGLGEQVAPLEGQRAGAHEAVLLRVWENDADQRAGRQLIDRHENRDEGSRVVERARRDVVHTIEQCDPGPQGEQRDAEQRHQENDQQSDQ